MEKNDQEIFLKTLLEGNRKAGTELAKRYSSNHENIKLFYETVVKNALYKVGDLWEYNMITVAAEHLATSVSESIMNDLYEVIISDSRLNKKAVLGCIENEYHQVGIKMIADIFEMNGWDTFFLGANIPNREFIDYVKSVQPDIVAISLSIYSHINALEKMIQLCQIELPQVKIIVGGQAFNHGGDTIIAKYSNVQLLKDFDSLEHYIKNL